MTQQETSIELVRIQLASSKAARFLRVLGNPSRLLLLCQLTKGEKNVIELEALTGVRQPTLSQQLTLLQEEQMINTRKDGEHEYYVIQSDAVLAVMNALYQYFCTSEEVQKAGPQL